MIEKEPPAKGLWVCGRFFLTNGNAEENEK